MGSLGIKTIIWFEVITTLVLGLGLLLANVLKPGVGLDLSHLAKKIFMNFPATQTKLLISSK